MSGVRETHSPERALLFKHQSFVGLSFRLSCAPRTSNSENCLNSAILTAYAVLHFRRCAVRCTCPRDDDYGQVGEWLKPTDCKSVPPCEVRRFESFPVHQIPYGQQHSAIATN